MGGDQSHAGTWPVEFIQGDDRRPAPIEGIGLCLSGGGSRAMLFHVGALWRLNELGMLPRLARISSVSGGSITAGVLATRWSRLAFDPGSGVAPNFEAEIAAPLRRFAGRNLDILTAVRGLLVPGSSPARRLAQVLADHLYGSATLRDLPETPRFVFNATNLQSGALWRFSRPYCADWRVGKIPDPGFEIATAVAASAAFPPFFAPLELDVKPSDFEPGSGGDLDLPEYHRRILLADGGVYDNLGLETVFKKYATVLVSDGGGKLGDEAAPATDWARETLRTMKVIDNQVRSLRKRLLMEAFARKDRAGAYWGIRSCLGSWAPPGSLPCPCPATYALAELPTRLAAVPIARQNALINWGYAISDAALRAGPLEDRPAPKGFPYPGGVGQTTP